MTLTGQDESLIAMALRNKAESDRKQAATLTEPEFSRLAHALNDQASQADRLADAFDNGEEIFRPVR